MGREGWKRGDNYKVLQASVPESRYTRTHHNPPLAVPQAQMANKKDEREETKEERKVCRDSHDRRGRAGRGVVQKVAVRGGK